MSGKLTLNGKAYVLVDRFNFTCALAIAVIAFSLGLYGYQARRRHRPGWPPHHAIGMGGSYIALLTGFYVDNGPFLPLWKQLPHLTYWLLPSLIGAPLIWLALHRYRRTTARTRPDGDPTAHRLDAKPQHQATRAGQL